MVRTTREFESKIPLQEERGERQKKPYDTTGQQETVKMGNGEEKLCDNFERLT